MSEGVTVQYYPVIVLSSDQVEYDGQVYECSGNCTGAGTCVCCDGNFYHLFVFLLTSKKTDLSGGRPIPCQKCSCQQKIPSVFGCFESTQACYYKGISTCPGSCSSSCNGDCTVNNPVFSTTMATTLVSCTQAQAYINAYNSGNQSDPNYIGEILNVSQITTQCSSSDQLLCCQGNTDLGSNLCGPYWGPSNTGGQCDAIMTSYCNTSPNDPLCACLKSDLPVPECTDKRCRLTDAMKLSDMLNNQCLGNYMTCLQYFELSSDAINNLIQNNTISQQCTQNNGSSSAGAATNSTIIYIIIAVVVAVFIAIVVTTIVLTRKKKPGSTPTQKQKPYNPPKEEKPKPYKQPPKTEVKKVSTPKPSTPPPSARTFSNSAAIGAATVGTVGAVGVATTAAALSRNPSIRKPPQARNPTVHAKTTTTPNKIERPPQARTPPSSKQSPAIKPASHNTQLQRTSSTSHTQRPPQARSPPSTRQSPAIKPASHNTQLQRTSSTSHTRSPPPQARKPPQVHAKTPSKPLPKKTVHKT
jgi:hypothetical protein